MPTPSSTDENNVPPCTNCHAAPAFAGNLCIECLAQAMANKAHDDHAIDELIRSSGARPPS